MFKRVLSMGLGLALLAGMTGVTSGSSTAKARAATQAAAAQVGGTYFYNTQAEALRAAGYFRDQGRIVFGPYEVNGHWEIVVSDLAWRKMVKMV
jgi:hypothetical protein